MSQFNGLAMPVFTAFGWAGEETAIQYALSQLELFVQSLHASLPRDVRDQFTHYGLDKVTQTVYLASGEDVEKSLVISFLARPMSMEMQLSLQDKQALTKAWKSAEKDTSLAHRFITELGRDWSLRVQQMQIDADSGTAIQYQDLFKEDIPSFDEETAVAVFSKANYLNSEDQWVVPFSLSRRFPSERIHAMGTAVIEVISEQIQNLMPLINFLVGKAKSSKPKARATRSKSVTAKPAPDTVLSGDENSFTFTSQLKALHLRRGFINLTSEHWDFFAINSRTQTRGVTIYYDGIYDKKSTVWHLSTSDQARIVLSPTVHEWLEDNFAVDDNIQVVAKQLTDDEIQISLKPIA